MTQETVQPIKHSELSERADKYAQEQTDAVRGQIKEHFMRGWSNGFSDGFKIAVDAVIDFMKNNMQYSHMQDCEDYDPLWWFEFMRDLKQAMTGNEL